MTTRTNNVSEGLDGLKKLLARATPGPLVTDDGDCGVWGVFSDIDGDPICYMIEPSMPGYRRLRGDVDETNAKLFAAAVNFLRNNIERLSPPLPSPPEPVCARCKGSRDDLAPGRDPEELCDPCYDDAERAVIDPLPSPGMERLREALERSILISIKGGLSDRRSPEDIVKDAVDYALSALPLDGGDESFRPTDEERAAIRALAAEQELSEQAIMRQAIRLYQLHHTRLKAGETVSFSGDAGRAAEFAGLAFGKDWSGPICPGAGEED